jgi:hypothetical protein
MRTSKNRFWISVISGILMVAAGVLFLLGNLEIITVDVDIIIGPIFGVGGLVFLVIFILDTDNWWALFPAFALTAIGIIIFMDNTMPAVAGFWSGAVFLGLLGLAFLLIYIFHREHWWALIPGGVLLTLAGVTLVSETDFAGGLFFLGLALTFGLIYLLPKPSGKSQWALYPAVILLAIGVLVTLGEANVLNYVWPLALLIAGGYVLFRSLKK